MSPNRLEDHRGLVNETRQAIYAAIDASATGIVNEPSTCDIEPVRHLLVALATLGALDHELGLTAGTEEHAQGIHDGDEGDGAS